MLQIARLTAINRRILSKSSQKLDFMSGPESDIDDAEDLRLTLDVADTNSLSKSSSSSKIINNNNINCDQDNSSLDNERKSRNSSESSDQDAGDVTIPRRDKLGRKTSQTLAEAFLEQLPEVRQDVPYQNGSVSPC